MALALNVMVLVTRSWLLMYESALRISSTVAAPRRLTSTWISRCSISFFVGLFGSLGYGALWQLVSLLPRQYNVRVRVSMCGADTDRSRRA